MSNEVIKLPDYLLKLVDEQSLSGAQLVSVGSSVPRLSLKGQKFRFIKGGEEVRKVDGPLHIVILGVQPESGMCKTFYAGKYNPDSSDPPDCSSSDGIRPDSWVSPPISPTCATCKNNAWGSAVSMAGKKAKACRDSKRLYIINPAEGVEDADGWILNVTVASLKALSEYGKVLVNNKMPLQAAVTTVSFVEDSDFPQLNFAFAGALKEQMGMACIQRATKNEWQEIEYKPQKDDDQDASVQIAEPIDEKPVAQVTESITIDQSAEEVAEAQSTGQESVDDILSKWD